MVQFHAKSLGKQGQGRNKKITGCLAHFPPISNFSAEDASGTPLQMVKWMIKSIDNQSDIH